MDPRRFFASALTAFAFAGCTNGGPAVDADPSPSFSAGEVRDAARPIVRLANRTDSFGPLRHYRPKPPGADHRSFANKRLPNRAGSSGPSGPDPVLQEAGPGPSAPTPGAGFDGVDNRNSVLPPDTIGDVGPNHYVQMVNLSFAVYSKTGATLYGPANVNTLWTGFGGPCETTNDGDPIVLYDQAADRWLLSQFALPNYPSGPFYQCIAVSQTGDPTGAFYRYEFLVSNNKLNDYPKLGVWPDGYYMAVNQFTSSTSGSSWAGQGAVVFERSKMLSGQLARMVYFDLYGVDSNLGGMLPADWDGASAPAAGQPNPFVQIDDDAWGYSGDQLQIWNFQVDWASPARSTFTFAQALPVAPFDSNLCGYARDCIPQRGTKAKLDALSDRLMYRLQYRRFPTHEALVTNHTVDVNGADRAGIRWYELRRTGGSWSIRQQSTYSPTSAHRWMGSIAMNGRGDMALGFSISDTANNQYPSIAYTARLAEDPVNAMTQGETIMHAGGGSQTNSASRWGDYSMMAVDPVDDCTFWYTTLYYSATSSASWRTRVGSFQLPGCGAPSCLTDADCNDGNACTTDTCVSGQCQHAAVSCNDGNACTTDTCDPATGCVHTPIVCDDGNACTADSCDAVTGCVFTPVVCNDGNACTADSCDAVTGCVFTPIVCDDGNPCTDDSCNPATGCVHTPNTAPCDDGNACTSGDTCSGGSCTGTPVVCDDANACTSDSCNPATGCVNTAIDCTSGNPCLAGSCNPATGCSTSPKPDGTSCPGGTCQGGTCVQNCTTFTGSVSSSVRNAYHNLGNKTNVTLKGTLKCPGLSGKDIDLQLQVRRPNGSYRVVAQSIGLTCDEEIVYDVAQSPYNGSVFRWRVLWYSGTGTIAYVLDSCEQ